MLFESASKPSSNDPILINPRGIPVRVPESRVKELLSKGFSLEDKSWRPTKEEGTITRDFPLPIEAIQEEVAEELDLLETTEI